MFHTKPGLMQAVRDRFAHIDSCPVQGSRIFFENAGGALTLNSVVDTSATYAAIPDNQGRANTGSQQLVRVIDQARQDLKQLLGASTGQVFVGESGTELLFRLISNAIIETPAGSVVGTTLEHPASRSAALRWAKVAGKEYLPVVHADETGSVEPSDYAAIVRPDTQVATIIHTSPVTGMGVDVAGCAAAIRSVAPDCFIIIDGIQHAAHGAFDIDAYDIDGYVISPYKMFSRHGYGFAWISDRLAKIPHDSLIGGPSENWELGTRDTGAYATISDVVSYLDWLGSQVGNAESATLDRRSRLVAAGQAIHDQERALTDAMLQGTGNLKGLAELPGISIIGGVDNPRREGLIAMTWDGMASIDLVEHLNQQGIRTHLRKADHYSGNVLDPLGLDTCVRVSLCHYNSIDEVTRFLEVMNELVAA